MSFDVTTLHGRRATDRWNRMVGWFHSGDSCVYGDDGQQIMVDRYKDIVKSGGENVASIRVEGVVGQHPAVDRVAVIGLPDERWGEAIVAWRCSTSCPSPSAARS